MARPRTNTNRAPRLRLDQVMADRGLVESREKARALVLAGSVIVNGQKADKPGHSVNSDAAIEIVARPPYVSRGGFKLAAALDTFNVEVRDKICLDVGSSTGGFTDCLLQRGAARVYAFDVGHGQLDWKLRNDPRVVAREGVNARYLQPSDLPEPVDFAACDVSFISATLLTPVIHSLLSPAGSMVILVKPQFEAGKGQVGKGGIVRNPLLHTAACDKVRESVERLGYRTHLIESPILGAEGNREFLLYGSH